ncbi:uncharacterized protein PHACADRAFT_183380 [Phanerochaete carnosa HHB-10118-sp]|uniref:DUF6534 domain-containing protein n=1 Tax=Phanerochaete carnosa (strain HHB-10118-sp) TaxID=650164 RepID=K5VZ17_PHACS|nr:uncharacterized protein PHACADRAFT_183380 [Phanerochaete carnosa HHB-10118-sp]EKM56793.1 hypothetical protein PHACADRAFT_183380 [Phanerochaete carnosa HHB-10118-sp]
MATQPPPPLTLQDLGLKASSTIGAILIGSFVVAMLYGIIVIQTMLFFQGQSHNNRYMRYTVAGLWVMNSVHMAFIIHPVYWYLVSNYLQPLAIVQIVWYIAFTGGRVHVLTNVELIGVSRPFAGGSHRDGEHCVPDLIFMSDSTLYYATQAVNDFIVRCWFVYRIWILSGRNRWATFPMTILCIFLFGLTIVTGVEFYQTKTYLRLVHTHVRWLVYTDLSLVFAADVLIAATLCYLLAISRTKAMNHKSVHISCRSTLLMLKLIYDRTESYVNILILYTINTGLLTSMLSMACLITFVTMPHNYVFVALYFPMMTLYANSLLAS